VVNKDRTHFAISYFDSQLVPILRYISTGVLYASTIGSIYPSNLLAEGRASLNRTTLFECSGFSATGTILEVPHKDSSAVIRDGKSGNEDLFVEGAVIFGKVILRKIEAQGVWLSTLRGIKSFYLPLNRDCSEASERSLTDSTITLDIENASDAVSVSPELKNTSSHDLLKQKVVEANPVPILRESIPLEPKGGLLSALGGVRLHSEELQANSTLPLGLLLSDIDPESFLGKMNIRDGDVLIAVNGQGYIGESPWVYDIVNSRNDSEITLTVERDGKPIALKGSFR
jgi:hypothetical protein